MDDRGTEQRWDGRWEVRAVRKEASGRVVSVSVAVSKNCDEHCWRKSGPGVFNPH